MKRREFIAGLSGTVASPLAAKAQRGERVRRISVLIGGSKEDPARQAYAAALSGGLAQLDWHDGRNLQIDLRFDGNDPARMRSYVEEMVKLGPEVMVVNSTPAARAVQQYTATIPIIFVQIADPVATGLVASLARPGGRATGFPSFEPSIGSKWVQLLKEIAPSIKRVMILYSEQFNPQISAGAGFYPSLEKAASAFGIKVLRAPVTTEAETVRHAIDLLAQEPNGSLILVLDTAVITNRATVYQMSTQYSLPAVYPSAYFAVEGGLIAYGPDTNDLWRRAATYVDRLLLGTKVSELPVQLPTKYELVINLKTAKALGLPIPERLLVIADQVIE